MKGVVETFGNLPELSLEISLAKGDEHDYKVKAKKVFDDAKKVSDILRKKFFTPGFEDRKGWKQTERTTSLILLASFGGIGQQLIEASRDNVQHKKLKIAAKELNSHSQRDRVLNAKWARRGTSFAVKALSGGQFNNWGERSIEKYKSEGNCLHFGRGELVTVATKRCVPQTREPVCEVSNIHDDGYDQWEETTLGASYCSPEHPCPDINEGGWDPNLDNAFASLTGGRSCDKLIEDSDGVRGLAFGNQVDKVSYCGEPCGYYQLPLMREVVSYRATSGFDPANGRHLGIMFGTTVVNFDQGRLVWYFEASQHFELNEDPQPMGPPKYIGEFFVGQPSPMYYPDSKGGVAENIIPASDGRGHSPGIATMAYKLAGSKITQQLMAYLYYKLYPENGASGCGMPDKSFFHDGTRFEPFQEAGSIGKPMLKTTDAWGVKHPICLTGSSCKEDFNFDDFALSDGDKAKLEEQCRMMHALDAEELSSSEMIEWVAQDPWDNPFTRNVYEGLFQDFRKSFQRNAQEDPDPL